MRGGGGLVASWLWVALALGPLALPAVAAESEEGGDAPKTIRVISRLELDADRSGVFDDSAVTTVQVPTGAPLAERALTEATLHGGEQFIEVPGSELLSSGLGLFEEGTLLPLPEATGVEAGAVVLETDFEESLENGRPAYGALEYEWNGELVVSSAKPRANAPVAWVVAIELDEFTLKSIEPPPTVMTRDGSGTSIEWRFPPGEARAIELRLQPPWPSAFSLDVSFAGWNELRGLVSLVLTFLFLPVLVLLLGRIEGARRLRRQALWLSAAAVLACLAAFASTLEDQILYGGERVTVVVPGWDRVVLEALPAILTVFFAAAIQAAVRPRAVRGWIALLALLTAAAIALLVVTNPFSPLQFVDRREWLEPMTFALAVGGWFVTLFFAVDGILRIAARGFSRGWGKGGIDGVAIGSALLVLLLAGAVAIGYSRHSTNLYSEANWVIPPTLIHAMYSLAALLPLALLPATVLLLAGASGSGAFLVRCRAHWQLVLALFVFVVVGASGAFLSFPSFWSLLLAAAVLWALARLRRTPLEEIEDEVHELNPGLLPSEAGRSLLVERKRELADRALLVERMQRLRTAEHQKLAKSEEGGEAYVAYRDRVAELDRAETYLEDGEPPADRTPSAADREIVGLRLPTRPPVIYAALAVGPGKDWRQNAMTALCDGARLAVLPIAYVLFVLIVKNDFGSVFNPGSGLELLSVFSLLAGELAVWLMAAFTFGCLFTWLPWGNGPFKGFLLWLPVLVGLGLFEFCPLYVGVTDWAFRCVETLAFLSVLGLLMDWRTVRADGLRLRDLADLYQVRELRFAVLNLTPFLLAALGIYQQIKAGDPQGAIEDALEAAGTPSSGRGGD